MKPISRAVRTGPGIAALIFGCYLEILGLDSMLQGPNESSAIVWTLLFSSSLIFIVLGLLVIWRQPFR